MSQQGGSRSTVRVAVLRALQLGDMLCAVPALRALRAALPQSEITLIGLPWARSFVERFHRYLDHFIEFPGYPGLAERTPDLAALPRFIEDTRSAAFDLVIQMHGSSEITNPLAMRLGGKRTAGFFTPGQHCPESVFFPYPANEPEIRRQIRLVQKLGMPSRGEHLEFPLTRRDWVEARQVAGSLLSPGRYVCIHAGARSADRRWSPEGFARLGERAASHGATVVLTGTKEEAAIADEVRRNMRAPIVDLVGQTSLGAMAAVISKARLVVCNDTGVSHIAAALSVPSVVMFTGSDPRRWAPLNARRHRIVVASSSLCEPDDVSRAAFELDCLFEAEGRHAA